MKLIIVSLLALSLIQHSAADPLPNQIIVDPQNKNWLKYNGGGPFFMAGAGDPEDFLFLPSSRQDEILNKMAGTGANAIYLMANASGDGPANFTSIKNGLADQAMFDSWKPIFDRMEQLDIVIYFFIYDDNIDPWNSGDNVTPAENAYLVSLVNNFKTYPNLIWCVAEEYAESLSSIRVRRIAEIIKSTDEHDHVVSVHQNNGLSFDFANDPNIDSFSIQYNQSADNLVNQGANLAWQNSAGKYNLIMSEAAGWGAGTKARQNSWATAMGGTYVTVLRWFYAGYTDPSTIMLQQMGYLRRFMETSEVNKMSPNNSLAQSDTTYVLASPENSYIAYGLNASNIAVKNLPPGSYMLKWINPVTGETITESKSTNVFSNPWGQGEVAVFIKSTSVTDQIAPSPPTGLEVE